MKRGILLILLFSILLASSVFALNACCEQTNDGDWCVYTDETECADGYLSTYAACEQTSYCDMGCCYTSDDGRCYKNTPQAACEAEEGTTWSSSADCEIEQCSLGCCVLADQAFYVTEVRCKKEASEFESVSMSFDETIDSEKACLESVKNQDWGCCVGGDTCGYTTREECGASSEVQVNFTEEGFHEGMLCSNDLLSCDCAKQQSTGCYEGNVYWYDSCGNRENIYSSDERASYNDGYELSEAESCVWTSGADSSSCGNCDYALGGTCGYDDSGVMDVGDYTCVDLNCDEVFENDYSPLSGDEKFNGESWCIYESPVGEGRDYVGSRHFRHVCINGEEITEPCADFRDELCISGILGEEVFTNMEALGLGQGDYVEAACRENRNEDCSSCNDFENFPSTYRQYDCCSDEDVRDCYWIPEYEGVYPNEEQEANGTCGAQVPGGLKFWSDSGSGTDTSDSAICNAASTECVVTYTIGGWNRLWETMTKEQKKEHYKMTSEEPAGCTTRDWLVDQNTYCKTLGDCGAYYNIAGEAGYDGFDSTMFDEDFFFEFDKLDDTDLGDWDFLNSYESNVYSKFGFGSPEFFKNPAFYIGAASIVGGGIAGAAGCEGEAEMQDQLSAANKAIENYKAAEKARKEAEEAAAKAKEDSPAEPVPAPEVPMRLGAIDGPGDVVADDKTISTVTSAGGLAAGPDLSAGKGFTCFLSGGLGGVFSGISGLSRMKDSQDFSSALGSASQVFMASGGGGGGALGGVLGQYGGAYQGAVSKAKTGHGMSIAFNAVTLAMAAKLVVQYAAKNETTITYNVDCNLWQPPSGGDNCELCNSEDLPCSEYRCRSLGAACEIVNEGTDNVTCVSTHVNDVNSPIIEPNYAVLLDGYEIDTSLEGVEGNKGFEIVGLVPAFTPVTLGVNTDEPSQCKYASEPGIEYDDMNTHFGSNVYVYNHSIMFSLGDEVTEEEVLALTEGVYTIYVKCSDSRGNANEDDYYIRFQVDTTPDLTPPEVVFTSLEDGSYIPYGVNETTFAIYVNEPSSCRWNENDTGYEFMNYEMDCSMSGFEQSSFYYGTYPCSTTLTGLSEDSINYYYFRCEDTSGNFNEDSYKLTLKATEDPLLITEVAPEGTLYDNDVTLEVETEDGSNGDVATCAYSPTDVDFGSMVVFANSNSSMHLQELTLIEGSYDYYFGCMDQAGNLAYNSTSFSIEVDNEAPQILTLYIDNVYSVLYLLMDEESTCEYAGVEFTYGEGSSMTGTNSTEHEASLDRFLYYIKCVDRYENYGDYVIDTTFWM